VLLQYALNTLATNKDKAINKSYC